MNPAGVLVVVEGTNDAERLRRISRVLNRRDWQCLISTSSKSTAD